MFGEVGELVERIKRRAEDWARIPGETDIEKEAALRNYARLELAWRGKGFTGPDAAALSALLRDLPQREEVEELDAKAQWEIIREQGLAGRASAVAEIDAMVDAADAAVDEDEDEYGDG